MGNTNWRISRKSYLHKDLPPCQGSHASLVADYWEVFLVRAGSESRPLFSQQHPFRLRTLNSKEGVPLPTRVCLRLQPGDAHDRFAAGGSGGHVAVHQTVRLAHDQNSGAHPMHRLSSTLAESALARTSKLRPTPLEGKWLQLFSHGHRRFGTWNTLQRSKTPRPTNSPNGEGCPPPHIIVALGASARSSARLRTIRVPTS